MIAIESVAAADRCPATVSARLRAMACTAEVVVVGGDASLLDLAVGRLAQLERCWTRFDERSDLCRIAAADGRAVLVDPSTVVLLRAMVNGWAATDGAFDPTLLAAIRLLDGTGPVNDRATSGRPPLTALLIDAEMSVVVAPPGIGLDPGAIGKGLAADLVADELVAAGATGALVSVGGDLRVRGCAPQPGGWTIAVGDALRDDVERARVRLADGGVATSGTALRHFTDPTGRTAHHVLDPSTGCSTDGHRPIEATVMAGTGAWAEVWATAVMVRGADPLFDHLDRLGLAARAVLPGGEVVVNHTWAAYACPFPEEVES